MPTEILHTVLLGVVKYFWGQTIVIIKKAHSMKVFETRLASINSEGLNIPKIGAKYMCAYSGSLIGKHFKTIAQVLEFVIWDLVPKDVLQAWRAIGSLVVLLWHTEISNITEYLVGNLHQVRRSHLSLGFTCRRNCTWQSTFSFILLPNARLVFSSQSLSFIFWFIFPTSSSDLAQQFFSQPSGTSRSIQYFG